MTDKSQDNVQLVDRGPAFDALGLVHRVRFPRHYEAGRRYPTLVMSHGFQGDENVTWVFARQAGPEWLIITPRAPFDGAPGYSWYTVMEDSNGKRRTDPATFDAGLTALTRFVRALPTVYPVDESRVVVLGFSQGAAMSYAYATGNPVAGVAALGGFIPGPIAAKEEALVSLHGVPVLVVHGTQDATIPIDIARQNRDQLIKAGAQVTYHESEIGHKVSSAGMRELSRWLAERLG